MGNAGTGGVVRLIQVLLDEGTVASLDDAELLRRFLRRDRHAEAAFAALVERYAPMVLRVCRDVTGDIHDAQDAAQVTFLILARKAGSIRRGEALSNWLFGTAQAGPIAVPIAWARSTTLAAMQLATGKATAAVAPSAVKSLVDGVSRTMFVTRLKWAATLAVFLGLSAGLTLAIARLTPGAGMQTPAKKTDGVTGASSRYGAAEPAQPAPITTPITVSGRATEFEGKPVAGASIFLVSTNGTDAPLGMTTTDGAGSYIFREARLPVRRWQEDAPLQGTFQVYGTAPGHGFAWHGMHFYQPRRRPDVYNFAGQDHIIYGGQPIVMDLRFPPAATLAGRIVDEAGRPIPGVRIRIATCDYLDTAGKDTHRNFREFWAIHHAPASLTTAETGPDGRFRLEGLPKEAGFGIDVEHPDYAGLVLYAATTARPTTAFDYPAQLIGPREERPSVATGELNVTLRATRRIAVRTVFADTGRPAPSVGVAAFRGPAGSAANGTTDADGNLVLRLPPGEYHVQTDPTAGGADIVRTLSTFKVTDQRAEQSLEVRVKPGCVLILEVVDAWTGRGVPGVEFRYEQDGEPDSSVAMQSRSGFIDNPRSNARGRLRAVVEPGERVYSVGRIPESTGYRQQNPRERVVLPAGKTVTARFKLDGGQRPQTHNPLRVARLMYDGDWNLAPQAIPNLMATLRRAPPRFDVVINQKDLLPRDPSLVYYPLLYLHGRGGISFSAQDLAGLRRYLDPGGGTLFADAACGSASFDAAFRRLVVELYPKNRLVPIPRNDEFFTTPALLDLSKLQYTKAAGGDIGFPQLEGVKINGHWAIIYSKLGIGCALDGEHDGGCKGYVRDDAAKIGMNVFVYSTLP